MASSTVYHNAWFSHACMQRDDSVLFSLNRVVVIDDLSNSQGCDDETEDMPPALWRAKAISGQENLHFIQG